MNLKVTSAIIIAMNIAGCVMAPSKDMEKAKDLGVPVIITKVFTSKPNFVGGVDVNVKFKNTSTQALKYVAITVFPYNKVGDLAPSEIGGETRAVLNDTGPIFPGRSNGNGYWKNVWYNHSIWCAEVSEVEVTYMSGEKATYKGSELMKVLASGMNNSCKLY